MCEIKLLVNEMYNYLLDMDFIDYNETAENELENLTNDLKLLKESGSGTLLNVIYMIMEDSRNIT